MVEAHLVDQFFEDERIVGEEVDTPLPVVEADGAGDDLFDFSGVAAADQSVLSHLAGAFFESDTIKQTMEKVKKFSFDHGLVKDDKFSVGFGKGGSEKLRFDPSYIRAGK